ncbi:hypothetical protein OKA04_14045 [Luteolibacter flavescens]|uniref:Uncharacterized protein n=1 Tax=Luteolibacter flavescens TaxID=1859460 RepID=A0ABT3FQL2_9BACT|nr:hypothetical protein [Luteolibacter flavescens]MCW1885857.1 hypothetical protein [Luteolibacter flavescens]
MLPQRRKSAEEIAKLRESLGIPGEAQEEATAPEEPAIETSAPVSADASPEEQAPADPAVEEAAKSEIPAPKPPVTAEEKPQSTVPQRQVRSLRKSEQKPVELPRVETKGGIPVRRHDDRELMEIRRAQSAPPEQTIAHVQSQLAPWPLVFLIYLLPFTGALLGWLAAWTPKIPQPHFPALWMGDLSRKAWLGDAGFAALTICCVLGLAGAGWIAKKKRLSRHHAGFITILAVLIAVFGIIHKFDPTHGP